jgi:hypothetical protein
MARWRRPGASELLWVFLALNVVAFALIVVWHPVPGLIATQWGLPVILFCTWRVSQGGRISRIYLILSSALAYGRIVLNVARSWEPAVPVLVLLFAAHVALLVSPPVFARTRPTPYPLRIGWTQLVRRPPSWLLPWALVGGMLLTLACLGNMGSVLLQPGCNPASDGCIAFMEGYPLRWLAGGHDVPVIDKYALLKDTVQWVLTCTSVLYLAWLWLTEPTGVRSARPSRPAGTQPGRP